MKKLISLVLAIAMVVSYMPLAYAGDSASLNLRVTFKPDAPLTIKSVPEQPYPYFEVKEGETLDVEIIAEDIDSINVNLECVEKPEDAKWIVEPEQPISAQLRRGTFSWTPAQGASDPIDGIAKIYVARFKATNHEGDAKELSIRIVVKPADVIAIELDSAQWVLNDIKLGERRTNNDPPTYQPLHRVKNVGNVPVTIDIGYPPYSTDEYKIHPGYEQGIDIFVMLEKDLVIPPEGTLAIAGVIEPQQEMALVLTYGAPTGLSDLLKDQTGHMTSCDIRAFKAEVRN